MLTKQTMYDGYFIFFVSFLMKAFQKEQYVELFLEVVESQTELTPWNKIFILHQLKTLFIHCPKLETEHIAHQIAEMESSIRSYLENTIVTERITREQRKDNLVFVMVADFLGENHPESADDSHFLLAAQSAAD